MHVVHVIERLAAVHGGSTAAALAIAAATRDDFSISVLGPAERAIPQDDMIIPLAGGRLTFPLNAIRWIHRRRDHIDIVEVHNVFSPVSLLTMLYCGMMNRKFVLNPHNSLDTWDLRKKRIRKLIIGNLLLRWVIARAGFVRCATKRELQRLATFGGHWQADWALLPINLTDNLCIRGQERLTELEQGHPLKILFISRIDRKKRLEILIRAIASSRYELGNCRLLIGGVGDAGYEIELKAMATELGVADIVEWRGFLQGDAKDAIFREADVFMLPSAYENFGIVVLEALASGLKPVVSANVFVADHLPHEDCMVVHDDVAYADIMKKLRSTVAAHWASPDAAAQASQLLMGEQGAGRIKDIYVRILKEKTV